MTTEVAVLRHEAMAGLWRQAIELAEGLSDDEWERPVPWTPQWRVKDLVAHLGGLQSVMNGDAQPAPPAGWTPPTDGSDLDRRVAVQVAARSGWSAAQRLEELRTASAAHVAALATTTDWLGVTQGPVGPTTHDGLFRNRAFDLWVHLQDLREALGLPLTVDDPSEGAAAAHNFVLGLVPWLFVKRAGAGEGATMRVTLGSPLHHDNVLSVTNRRATWDPTADAGDCSLTGAPGALTLLVAGRGAPDRWRGDGVLDWTGPHGEEFVERARLF